MPIPSTADTIIWRLHLRSTPQRVYELLDSDEGRSHIWSESTVERDGIVEFRSLDGSSWQCPIVERVPGQRFAFEYGGLTQFDLEDDGRGGTDLTLTYTGFSPEDRDDALPGWLNVLLPLKAWADFGVDLHNRDPERDWARGYVDH